MNAFYARPHPLWQTNNDGTLRTENGKLVPVIQDGKPVVRAYSVAIGSGEQSTVLSSGLVLPWRKFKTKKAAKEFCESFSLNPIPQ